MDLELATTHDILMELNRRNMHFAFVGMEDRNRLTGKIYYACYGKSRREILRLIRLMQSRVLKEGGPEADTGASGDRGI